MNIKAQQEAERLVRLFMRHVPLWDDCNDTPLKEKHEVECALICVDEMDEAINFDWMEVQNLDRQHAFYNDVRNELLKMKHGK